MNSTNPVPIPRHHYVLPVLSTSPSPEPLSLGSDTHNHSCNLYAALRSSYSECKSSTSSIGRPEFRTLPCSSKTFDPSDVAHDQRPSLENKLNDSTISSSYLQADHVSDVRLSSFTHENTTNGLTNRFNPVASVTETLPSSNLRDERNGMNPEVNKDSTIQLKWDYACDLASDNPKSIINLGKYSNTSSDNKRSSETEINTLPLTWPSSSMYHSRNHSLAGILPTHSKYCKYVGSAQAHSQSSFISSPEPYDRGDCHSLPLEKHFSQSGALYSLHSDSPNIHLLEELESDEECNQEFGCVHSSPVANRKNKVDNGEVSHHEQEKSHSFTREETLCDIEQCAEQACMKTSFSLRKLRQCTENALEQAEKAESKLRLRLNRLTLTCSEITKLYEGGKQMSGSNVVLQDLQVSPMYDNQDIKIDSIKLNSGDLAEHSVHLTSSINSDLIDSTMVPEVGPGRPEGLPKLELPCISFGSSKGDGPTSEANRGMHPVSETVSWADSFPMSDISWLEKTQNFDTSSFSKAKHNCILTVSETEDQPSPTNRSSNKMICLEDSPSLSLGSFGIHKSLLSATACNSTHDRPQFTQMMHSLSEPLLCGTRQNEIHFLRPRSNSHLCLAELKNDMKSGCDKSVQTIHACVKPMADYWLINNANSHNSVQNENTHSQTIHIVPSQKIIQPEQSIIDNSNPYCVSSSKKRSVPAEPVHATSRVRPPSLQPPHIGDQFEQDSVIEGTDGVIQSCEHSRRKSKPSNITDPYAVVDMPVPPSAKCRLSENPRLCSNQRKTPHVSTQLRYILLKHRLKLARAKDALRLRQRIVKQLETLFHEVDGTQLASCHFQGIPTDWDTDTSSLFSMIQDDDANVNDTFYGAAGHTSFHASNKSADESLDSSEYSAQNGTKMTSKPRVISVPAKRTGHARKDAKSTNFAQPLFSPCPQISPAGDPVRNGETCVTVGERLSELRNRAEHQLNEMVNILKRKSPRDRQSNAEKSTCEPLPPPPSQAIEQNEVGEEKPVVNEHASETSSVEESAYFTKSSRGGLMWFEPYSECQETRGTSQIIQKAEKPRPSVRHHSVPDGKPSVCSGDGVRAQPLRNLGKHKQTRCAAIIPRQPLLHQSAGVNQSRQRTTELSSKTPSKARMHNFTETFTPVSSLGSVNDFPDGSSSPDGASLGGLLVTPRGMQFSIPNQQCSNRCPSNPKQSAFHLFQSASLQSVFEQRMSRWISRSRERQKRIKLASEHRRYEQAMNEERLRLFGSSTRHRVPEPCCACVHDSVSGNSFVDGLSGPVGKPKLRQHCCSAALTRIPVHPTAEPACSLPRYPSDKSRRMFLSTGSNDGCVKPKNISKQRRINPARVPMSIEQQKSALENKLAQLRVNRLRMKIYGEKVLRSVLQRRAAWSIPTNEL